MYLALKRLLASGKLTHDRVTDALKRGYLTQAQADELRAALGPEPVKVPAEGTAISTTVTGIDPLKILVDGVETSAMRLMGYTPEVGDVVKATFLGGQWVVEDRVVAALTEDIA